MTSREKTYPAGGDPDDFCECGHHEMNHANYHGLPRACNQTGCDCYQFAKPVTSKLPPGSPAGETASEEEFIPFYGEPVSDQALLEMAHRYCQCPPEARASWSCEHCRAIAQLIFFRQSAKAVPEPVPTEGCKARGCVWGSYNPAFEVRCIVCGRLQPAAPEAAAARAMAEAVRASDAEMDHYLRDVGQLVTKCNQLNSAAPIAPAAEELMQEMRLALESVLETDRTGENFDGTLHQVQSALAHAEEYRKGAKNA